MKLQPVVQDPQKWVAFYKASMNGSLKKKVQRGSGGTLGPRTKGQGYTSVKDVVTTPVVTPTEQVVQQAKSEVKQRQKYKKIIPYIHKVRRDLTFKGRSSKQGSKKKKQRKVKSLKKT